MNKVYEAELTQVQVIWEEIFPEKNEYQSNRAILFFPGWPLKGPVKTLRMIGMSIANSAKARTYIVYTKGLQILPNPSFQEAQAICKFLEEKEMKHITIVGYSQGGIKAINTIIILQKMYPSIYIEGLFLINSAGLNNKSKKQFVINYAIDLTLKTWVMITRESINRSSLKEMLFFFKSYAALDIHGAIDMFASIWIELRFSIRDFFTRFINELNESTKRNPYLDQIKVPTILIQGAYDRSFGTNRIKTQPESLQVVAKMELSCKDTNRQIFAVNLFPQSPYIKVVKARKFGIHLLPMFRSKSLAQASFYLLHRYQRIKK